MLLCAVLRGDRFGTEELVVEVKKELDGIESRPKSKMSVSVRAFLQSALYIATRDTSYYKEAMDYFNAQKKLSEVQRELVEAMEKYEH